MASRSTTANIAAPVAELAELIGQSPAILAVRALIDRVADSDATVVVTGPSGSGKEVVARRLHQRGSRAAAPFVAINCAAIPAELLESELFGHEAGAFTGASRARTGRFEAAHRGTLFLDEIGDMPPAMQVKLLRVLETRAVERVGGMLPIAIDVRLVAATNADLDDAIAAGRFREDLFYRLNVVTIELPSLAERRGDIALLIEHFTHGRRIAFAAGAVAMLAGQPWRGNVRELRNLVERAAALHPGEVIDTERAHALLRTTRRPVEAWLAAPAGAGLPHVRPPASFASRTPVDLKRLLDEVELDCIRDALARTEGAVAESARLLGLRRTTLVEKMRRFNIGRAAA